MSFRLRHSNFTMASSCLFHSMFFSEIRIPTDSNNSHEAGCNKPWHDLQLARVFWHRSFCKPIWFIYGNTTCQRFSSWTYWNQRVSVDKKNIPFHLPIESFSFVGLLLNVHLFPPKTCNIMQHKFHVQAGRELLGLLGLWTAQLWQLLTSLVLIMGLIGEMFGEVVGDTFCVVCWFCLQTLSTCLLESPYTMLHVDIMWVAFRSILCDGKWYTASCTPFDQKCNHIVRCCDTSIIRISKAQQITLIGHPNSQCFSRYIQTSANFPAVFSTRATWGPSQIALTKVRLLWSQAMQLLKHTKPGTTMAWL